jgi:hypothetical protein
VPNLLPLVIKVAAEKGQPLTFSQAKKTARRMERRCESWQVVDELAYVLHYWDSVGEEATDNVMAEQNAANAARRVAA